MDETIVHTPVTTRRTTSMLRPQAR
jgi:hypothetical protein